MHVAMTCAEVRDRLPRHPRGEDWPALAGHLRTCAACRQVWQRLDPVGASAAYGQVGAPAGLAPTVLAAIAAMPVPVRRPVVTTTAGVASGALIVAWWLGGRFGPPALHVLIGWLAAVAGGAGTWAGLVRTLLIAAGPLAVAAATAVVLAEMVVLRHLKRLHVR